MKKRNIKLFESYSNSYKRVIPRDFFNEAKLLKCMGVLALAVLDHKTPENIEIKIDENDEAFDIVLDEMFNLICVSNYEVQINGEYYTVGTTYNSKSNFPFYVIVEDEEVEIFDDNGKFSNDFIEKFAQ